MKYIATIGLDTGNFDTKTQHTSFPSGLECANTLPFGVTDYLFYNNIYVMPSEVRLSYEQDKSTNENTFFLSLIAIAKELLWQAEHSIQERQKISQENKDSRPPRTIQQELDDVKEIYLGIGLPPTHVSVLSEKLISYYQARLGDGISYEYNGYHFSYRLSKIRCFPQGFSALLAYQPEDRENSALSFPSYYGIDIGGWTVDIVTILNKKIVTNSCDSKPLGVLEMYEKMIREVEVRYGKRLTITDLENILKGGKTLLPSEIIQMLQESKHAWYKTIITTLKQFGIAFDIHPVIFLGGGSLLFKENIQKDQQLIKYELLFDPKANAMSYALLMGKEEKR